ncbi:MAG: PDZ domain-containing protein [Gemmatimonadetes bacterium]|nr:PDZ domain-containing protein [Gemmatimonadota bacterium]
MLTRGQGIVVAAAFVAGVAVAGTGMEAVRQARAQEQRPVPSQRDRVAGPAAPASLSQAFRRAADQALPGVVHVKVEGTARGESMFGAPIQQRMAGSGSGCVIRPDGYILTNNHVVAQAERITVVTQQRQEYDAEVVGRDPNTDLAVIRIAAHDLPVATLGDSDAAGVGDWVVALGYPLQLGVTATAGIVSAKGRALNIIERTNEAPAPLEHFIQTDAAINPGNSGGPLVDLDGQVIGVNSAIKSQTGFYSGYGFAIPANLAKRVADDLIAYGHVRRPMIGVQVGDVDPVDVDVYRLPRAAGAEVVQVSAGSPADRAGIRLGDVVTGVNGRPIEWSGDLTERLALMSPGTRVRLDLIRYGEPRQVEVQLGEFDAPKLARAEAPDAPADGTARLGFAAVQLTPTLARRYQLPADHGVAISGVAPGSPADGQLATGMVVESLNGQRIEAVQDLEKAAARLRPGAAVSLIVKDPNGDRRIVNYRAA